MMEECDEQWASLEAILEALGRLLGAILDDIDHRKRSPSTASPLWSPKIRPSVPLWSVLGALFGSFWGSLGEWSRHWCHLRVS